MDSGANTSPALPGLLFSSDFTLLATKKAVESQETAMSFQSGKAKLKYSNISVFAWRLNTEIIASIHVNLITHTLRAPVQ